MIAVLFARADSCYKALPGCDVWDAERDARLWGGGAAVVAHPPCRAWGRLRHMARPRVDEKDLARLAVSLVRRFGGVLEHPAFSTLWADQQLPLPGSGADAYGGWTLPIVQHWWGHRAEKATWLYVVGCAPSFVPSIPLDLSEATHKIGGSGRRRNGSRINKGEPGWRPEVSHQEREHTPPALAAWLVDLAGRCNVKPAPDGFRQSVGVLQMQVWQSVKAKPGHARGGDDTGAGAEAGTVIAVDPEKTDEVVIRWDSDLVCEAVAIDQLTALS